MIVLGRKARKGCGVPSRGTFCTTIHENHWHSMAALLEAEPDRPPRLCRKDLKDPERFHQRLVDWLMKQR
jgi:hypothetical protein